VDGAEHTTMHATLGFSIDPNPNRQSRDVAGDLLPGGATAIRAREVDDGRDDVDAPRGGGRRVGPIIRSVRFFTDLYHVASCRRSAEPRAGELSLLFQEQLRGGFGETWDGGATWVIHPPMGGLARRTT